VLPVEEHDQSLSHRAPWVEKAPPCGKPDDGVDWSQRSTSVLRDASCGQMASVSVRRPQAVRQAHEGPPATWTMRDTMGHDYARIELRRTEQGPRYKVTARGRTLGWATTLQIAVERAHQEHRAGHGPRGAANGGR